MKSLDPPPPQPCFPVLILLVALHLNTHFLNSKEKSFESGTFSEQQSCMAWRWSGPQGVLMKRAEKPRPTDCRCQLSAGGLEGAPSACGTISLILTYSAMLIVPRAQTHGVAKPFPSETGRASTSFLGSEGDC